MARGISDGLWGADNFEPSGSEREVYEAVKARVREESLRQKRLTYRDQRKGEYRCSTMPDDFLPRTYRYLGPKVRDMWLSDYHAISSTNGDV